jgi:hypothetical protein
MILERVFATMKKRWMIINMCLLLSSMHYPWKQLWYEIYNSSKTSDAKKTKHLLGQFQHEMPHVASSQRNLTTTTLI